MNPYQLRAAFYFKDMYGEPFKLSEGQSDIFRLIHDPTILRAAIRTTTQYGKSETASLALLMCAVERREKILIVSPSEKQSSIIMDKIIQHIFDHPYLIKMIEYYGSLEKLKQERSKTRITFRNGSEIFILTAQADTVSKNAKNLMGFGATIVLVDESGLIPDILWSKILRMVGGVKNGKIVQLGNPFEKNHFYNACHSPRYVSIKIDWRQALAEGRLSKEFLDEAKEDMTELDWQIFYEVEFPSTGAEDALIPESWLEIAINQANVYTGFKQGGLDVARFGRDKSVYILRDGGNVRAMRLTEQLSTMEVAGWASGYIDSDTPEITAVDVVGLGAGVYDRLEELGYSVAPVNFGEAPVGVDGTDRYFNLRAECFFHLREQFKPDAQGRSRINIPNDIDLRKQLSDIRYKYSSEKKYRIEAKEDMKKRTGKSPDKADALALAFWDLSFQTPTFIIG